MAFKNDEDRQAAIARLEDYRAKNPLPLPTTEAQSLGGKARGRKLREEGDRRRALFLECLAQDMDIEECCAEVGIKRRTYNAWREKYPEFKHQVALIRGEQASSDKARTEWEGNFVGWRKKYLDTDTTWFQQAIVDALENSEPGSITLVLYPPEHGKACRWDTPILTCYGGDMIPSITGKPIPTKPRWVPISKLEVGDYVFGRDGTPTKVTGVYPQGLRPMRRVNFTDGTHLDVDLDHNWYVKDRHHEIQRTPRRHWEGVLTTAEMEDRVLDGSGRRRLSIPVSSAVQLPEAELPLDPWLLGYWLGDGATRSNKINTHVDDLDWVAERYFRHFDGHASISERSVGTTGVITLRAFTAVLKQVGVFGNKHIPDQYVLASESQRRALLAGLIDSDGHVNTHSNQIELSFTDQVLARDAASLIRSLGIKASVSQSEAAYTIEGVRKVTGTRYRILWSITEDCLASIPRKQAAWKPNPNPQGDRIRRKYIGSIEVIPNDDAWCISVDAPDHLYLAGKDFIVTHNTTTIEDWITFKLCIDKEFRITYGSEAQNMSRKALLRIRNRLEADSPFTRLVSDFGPFAPQKRTDDHKGHQPWGADFFDVYGRTKADERDYSLTALGFGSQIAGTRTDLLVGDDLISMKNVAQSEHWLEVFRQDWLTRPGVKGRTVIIGTRVANDDLYEMMIKEGIIDHLIKFKAYDPDRTATHGSPWLWPEMYDEAGYAKLRKNVGEQAWQRNYQQAPRLAGDSTFTERMIETAQNPMRSVISAVPADAIGIVLGLDPGYGTNAIISCAANVEKLWVLGGRVDHGLTNSSQIFARCETQATEHATRTCPWLHLTIEDKAFQKGLLDDEAMEDVQRRHGFTVAGHTTGAEKNDPLIGIPAIARDFLRGVIELPGADDEDTERFLTSFTDELLAWRPFKKGTVLQQDLVMAFYFAWLWWRRYRETMDTRSNGLDVQASGLPWNAIGLSGITRLN